MANTTATVAGLLFRGYCAFAANMSLSTTVVTSWGALLGTVTGLMGSIATVETSTTSGLETHIDRI